MTEETVPFTIDIQSCDGRRMQITCLEVMRIVAGTRRVYKAVWESRPVIVKLFVRFGKARYHMKREWRGLQCLQERRLSTPKPLFCGRTSSGWVVVTERIEGALTASELWEQADTLEQKVNLLCRIATQLARQHIAGVIQSDLHLGNFLIRGEETYILDPAMMRFRRNEVDRSRSIRQVALLTANVFERVDPAVERLFGHYAAARSWTVQRGDLDRLRSAHRRYRKDAIERGLRKFLRANKRHQAIRHGPWSGLVDRGLLKTAGTDGLTTELDEAMSRGRILKNGRTSFVSHTTLGGCDVVIKRYNHKGLLHSLRHTLRGSRAKRSWSNANRLRLLGIPTPRPLAYIDESRGPVLWRSYFVTEFVNAPRLSQLLQDRRVAESSKQESGRQVLEILGRLEDHHITHGDLKHSNILIGTDGPVLTDLDAMRVHRLRWTNGHRRSRDMARFRRDCQSLEKPSQGPNP
jgi:tRNA A-37 threonylcarbamoyl transferase component Bud32